MSVDHQKVLDWKFAHRRKVVDLSLRQCSVEEALAVTEES